MITTLTLSCLAVIFAIYIASIVQEIKRVDGKKRKS